MPTSMPQPAQALSVEMATLPARLFSMAACSRTERAQCRARSICASLRRDAEWPSMGSITGSIFESEHSCGRTPSTATKSRVAPCASSSIDAFRIMRRGGYGYLQQRQPQATPIAARLMFAVALG